MTDDVVTGCNSNYSSISNVAFLNSLAQILIVKLVVVR